MARTLISTKLFIPKVRRHVVTRTRLLDSLRRAAESRLTLVSAPAGFGKTTLLAEWLGEVQEVDRRIAWVSLDAADSDPASFWTYVVSALQTAVPGVGPSALELIPPSDVSIQPVLTMVLNDLAMLPDDVWLVLDDYHLVDSHEVANGMVFLLDHIPSHVHVVISTRADPELPLSRWRVRGELVELRAAELRFTSGEVTAYLNEVAGLDLSARDVAALEQRTEGWVAALQLAALSLQGREDVAGFIAGFAGNDRYIVDYLVEEVLKHQPEPVRTFLLLTAVLDRFSGPLCDALTGGGDGTEMLTALERANLFIIPLDDRRERYRYHHLFADVLRARLLSEQPELVPMLHQRASTWYERNDLLEDAVRHALEAQDFNRAARLMEMAVPIIRRNRQEALLFGWLTALPADAVRNSPVLSVFFGFMLMASGNLPEVEAHFEDAEQALAAVPAGVAAPWTDTEELRTLSATIAVYRASLAQARGDVAGTLGHARQALALAGAGDHLARGAAAGFLGLAAWAKGELLSALETFAQAVASLHASGNLIDALSSTAVLADMWLAAGRPGTARGLYQEALKLADAEGDPVARATAELHVGLGDIDREAGNLAAATLHLATASAFFERAPLTESRHRWFIARALIARAEGNLDEATNLLDHAEQTYRPGFFPEVQPIGSMRARIWIVQGKRSEAAEWAQARGVSVTDEVSYLSEFDHLTLVRLLLAQDRERPDSGASGQADHLLGRLLKSAETDGRAGSVLEIRMLQALARAGQGHRAQARGMLGRAFAEAPEPTGYAGLFLAEGPPMMELLRDAANHGNAEGHPQRLLTLAMPPKAQAPVQGHRLISSAEEKLSRRELQVLQLLGSELSGPEIAQALFISPNTLRTHTKHIFTKLAVTTRQSAVRQGRDRGLT
ncbi:MULTISPECIES: LuxR C-terminal-related transcriptional regulator [unclassified Arthrobacter]|uniref:LuxR C-terminal-related transcriptional regulator n=1 Tax=unclassified Arthrobacter TaxID=235627 RepID=UPI002E037F2A|nr:MULTISPECIES: LuxR C-terminal-related transcriptional regulator [unclassified Arthrobacter]MEC5191908.1 LuxR family maltose regulon positive regulatory protein [Arthrobacter sp. MP_M4]MEC5202413.1 LuxR family maltose regulon positive regulatory protein [Arthrobacter sp. MP_M7]